MAVWMINWLAIFVAARSVGIEMRYVDVVGVSAIAALLVLLPITVLGIGTRDATFVVLLARIGLSKEAAIALSSLMLLATFGLICSLSLLSREAREAGSRGLEGGDSDG